MFEVGVDPPAGQGVEQPVYDLDTGEPDRSPLRTRVVYDERTCFGANIIHNPTRPVTLRRANDHDQTVVRVEREGRIERYWSMSATEARNSSMLAVFHSTTAFMSGR